MKTVNKDSLAPAAVAGVETDLPFCSLNVHLRLMLLPELQGFPRFVAAMQQAYAFRIRRTIGLAP